MLSISLATVFIFSLFCAGFGKEDSSDGRTFDWNFGDTAKKTYLLTNVHWWESMDHQMTSIVTLLALAQNTSSIAVIPTMPPVKGADAKNASLLGDYFDIEAVKQVQPVVTFADFLNTEAYALLRDEKAGTMPLPKDSQEEFEGKLKVFGELRKAVVKTNMPPVDPENTSQKCDSFGGTMHVSADRTTRYVFLDRIHFLHFCCEKFMPWWYDVRHRISPRKPYFEAVKQAFGEGEQPLSTVHISDLMASQKQRSDEEIERYARQIVDSLRKNQVMHGSMYLLFTKGSKNVHDVARLMWGEFDKISDCSKLFGCGENVPADIFDPPISDEQYAILFGSKMGLSMMEWALSSQSNLFIGNVFSPYSRNVCLHRKTHGKPYAILKGFAELRKVWSWKL